MAGQTVITEIQKPPYGLYRLPHLGDSLLQVLIPAEARTLWQQESWNRESGRSARTLVKYPDLRILLVSMKTGARIKRHKTDARIAILTLAGHVRLHLGDASVEVPKGELLALDSTVAHEVEAIQQSTFLMIIAWPHEAKESRHD